MKSNTIATPRTDCALATPFTNILQNECYNRMVECSRKLEAELEEKTNEVARLRELLNRAIPWIEAYDCGNTPCTCEGLEELIIDIKKEIREELARFAPAPDEPDTYFREPNAEESKVLDKILEKLRKEDRHYHHESYCRKCNEPK